MSHLIKEKVLAKEHLENHTHTFRIKQNTLLYKKNANDFLDFLHSFFGFLPMGIAFICSSNDGDGYFDFFIYRNTTVARLTDLFQKIVVEFRIDGEHENITYWGHCLIIGVKRGFTVKVG